MLSYRREVGTALNFIDATNPRDAAMMMLACMGDMIAPVLNGVKRHTNISTKVVEADNDYVLSHNALLGSDAGAVHSKVFSNVADFDDDPKVVLYVMKLHSPNDLMHLGRWYEKVLRYHTS